MTLRHLYILQCDECQVMLVATSEKEIWIIAKSEDWTMSSHILGTQHYCAQCSEAMNDG